MMWSSASRGGSRSLTLSNSARPSSNHVATRRAVEEALKVSYAVVKVRSRCCAAQVRSEVADLVRAA